MIERLLGAVLRGDQTRWPFADEEDARRFLADAARHHVLPLLARQLRRGILTDAPEIVQRTAARAAVQQAAVEERLAAEVRRVVEALARAGVPSLLTKGTGLAYTHYPYPCLRPRTDTDLLIRAGDQDKAASVLEALQYQALDMTRGDLILHQRTYTKADALGIRHVYDLHWKVAAPRMVADLLRWEEADAAARQIPALGDRARTLGDAHALLLACVHRIAHHYHSDRLLWLVDIHLLASGLDKGISAGGEMAPGQRQGWRDFRRLAAGAAAAAMCAESLALARERCGTLLPPGLLEELAARGEASAAPFHRRARMIDVLVSELEALPGWRERLRLLRQHLLPPADYIRKRYGVSTPVALPVLYLHRCAAGARKWFQPLADRASSD